jgi:CPA1 family monovalent cation:H+ antiporter
VLRAEFVQTPQADGDDSEPEHRARNRLRARIVAEQRHALVAMRDRAEIGDDAFHRVEEHLDRLEMNLD